MLRSTLLTAGVVALTASATAQSRLQHAPTPIPAPAVKHGGTYHAATGTITHGPGAVSNFGAVDAIYSNIAGVNYFSDVVGPNGGTTSGGRAIETGGVPTTQNTLVTGVTRDDNFVTSFDLAYCDLDPAGMSGWDITFYNGLAPGSSSVGETPLQTVSLTGLPANGCWIFNIDLTGGMEFCLEGDGGDGVFDNDPDFDSFAWGHEYTGTGTASAGLFLAGDPSATDANYINPNTITSFTQAPVPDEGTGTYYNPLSGCQTADYPTFDPNNPVLIDAGTGFLMDDAFFIDDLVGGGTNSGYFYYVRFAIPFVAGSMPIGGGYLNRTGACNAIRTPFGSFYMEVQSTADCGGTGPTSFPLTACQSTANTSGAVGLTEATGSNVVGDNNLTLRASNLPTQPVGVFGIFLHSENDISSQPISVGQGVLCLGAAGRFNAPNQIKQADPNGNAELSTTAGEFSLSNLPVAGPPFTIAAMAGSTSYFGFWHRDFTSPQASAYNFTQPCGVNWQ